jgi:chitin disaccharide deacetylase
MEASADEQNVKRQVIVNADDYGRGRGISAGIREAHLRGIVTSTTVMITFPGAGQDVGQAARECPALGIGVHLCLTAGRPVLPSDQIPSLVAADGDFPRGDVQLGRLGELAAGELRAELRAQIELVLALGGRVDHLDSHHHATYLHPTLLGIMLDLAREYGLPVRNPIPRGGLRSAVAAGLAPPGTTAEAADALEAVVRRQLTATATQHPKTFVASFYGAGVGRDEMLAILDELPAGVSEIMCHPGVYDEGLESTYNAQRERELQILVDPQVHGRIDELGIALITFGDLTFDRGYQER